MDQSLGGGWGCFWCRKTISSNKTMIPGASSAIHGCHYNCRSGNDFQESQQKTVFVSFCTPFLPSPHFSVSCLCSFESYVHPLVLCKPCIICWFNWQIWSASIFASPLAAICLKQDPFRFKFCPKIWWTIPSLFGPFVKDWGQFLGTVCAQYLQIICTVFGRPLLRWTCTFIRKCLIWKGKEGGSS